jgi:hypothetical protein
MSMTKRSVRFQWALTFGRAVDDLVFLLGVFQDALAAEHLFICVAIELDLFGGVGLAVLDSANFDRLLRLRLLIRLHRKPGKNLVVHGESVRLDLMRRLVVGALDHSVFG